MTYFACKMTCPVRSSDKSPSWLYCPLLLSNLQPGGTRETNQAPTETGAFREASNTYTRQRFVIRCEMRHRMAIPRLTSSITSRLYHNIVNQPQPRDIKRMLARWSPRRSRKNYVPSSTVGDIFVKNNIFRRGYTWARSHASQRRMTNPSSHLCIKACKSSGADCGSFLVRPSSPPPSPPPTL